VGAPRATLRDRAEEADGSAGEKPTGHSGGAHSDPRHQTTVEPIAASDLPSGPKMRTPRGAPAGR
jgi:hypothetical protein